MMFSSSFLLLASGIASVFAAPSADVSPRGELVSRQSCNTATNRACWSTGFDINTDYETKIPLTGNTQQYTLVLTEVNNWVGPDGVTRDVVMLINGTFPGPQLNAKWGDRLNITVINNLQTNGTSIHWHGIRQRGSNMHDGVNGLTECPIPPKGGKRVYSFIAEQYGTTWYHSHFSAQYGNLAVGTLVIDGPASLPYDIDLGPLSISDYYLRTADRIVKDTETQGPPQSELILFNGKGKNNAGAGSYATMTLTKGKRHRLRLINTSVEHGFTVSLRNHSMTVIATDLVPVNSKTVDSIFMGIGQRYDVTIDASQAIDNYWFNVTMSPTGCGGASKVDFPAAIFRYSGAAATNPKFNGTLPTDPVCMDSDYTPVVTRTIPTSNFTANTGNRLPVHLDLTSGLFRWQINGTQISINWERPVDEYVLEGNTSYPPQANVVKVDSANQWAYWLLENDPNGAFALPHPIHLHGHDFVVLGKSQFDTANPSAVHIFDPTTDLSRLNGNNPTRRDVTMLPPKGWILIAFKTDNPGVWLMHCHIAWHISGGLGVQFLERIPEFRAGIPPSDAAQFNSQCAAWRTAYAADPFKQQDSGLKRHKLAKFDIEKMGYMS